MVVAVGDAPLALLVHVCIVEHDVFGSHSLMVLQDSSLGSFLGE